MRWVVLVVTVGAGIVGMVSIGLGMMVVGHWKRKLELRRKKETRRKRRSPNSSVSHMGDELKEIGRRKKKKRSSSSSNSDVESSEKSGYQAY